MKASLEWPHFVANVSDFLGVDVELLERDTSFYDDLGIDSLGLFSLGMHLVKTYGISVPLSIIPTIRTVGDAFTAMQEHGKKKGAKAESGTSAD